MIKLNNLSFLIMKVQSCSVLSGFSWIFNSFKVFCRFPIKLTAIFLAAIGIYSLFSIVIRKIGFIISRSIRYVFPEIHEPWVRYFFHSEGLTTIFSVCQNFMQISFLVVTHLIVTENKLEIKKLIFTFKSFSVKKYFQLFTVFMLYRLMNLINLIYITSFSILISKLLT